MPGLSGLFRGAPAAGTTAEQLQAHANRHAQEAARTSLAGNADRANALRKWSLTYRRAAQRVRGPAPQTLPRPQAAQEAPRTQAPRPATTLRGGIGGTPAAGFGDLLRQALTRAGR